MTPDLCRVKRMLVLAAAVLLTTALLPAVEMPLGSAPVDVGALGVSSAEAQAWGMARRTSRRTSRRTYRRQEYIHSMPSGYSTTAVYGNTYYVSEGDYYTPMMVEGRVVYVPAEVR